MKKQNRKRILSMLVAAVMLFSLFSQSLSLDLVALGEEIHTHDGVTFTAWTSTNSLPSSAGNYYLASDVTISSTWSVPSGTTNLCLNGHGIRMTGTGSVIYIAGGAALNLYDCDETTEHKFTVSDSAANGAGLAVVNDAATGEGVKTFTGGYITGGNANPYGGGVCIAKSGKFNLYGGTIIGNKASSHGGGVSASGAGQGVSNTKNFVMSGGAICYNTAPWGGGIAVYGEVYISGNSLISKNVSTAGGAGIELESNGRLYLEGGSITENLLSGQNGGMWKGAGVHVPGGSEFHIKGTAQVTNNYQSNGTTQNNVFVRSGQEVTVDDTLAENARIGIALQDTTGAFTSGLSGKGSAKNFVSDNGDYGILLKDGEAEIAVVPHEHDSVTFTKWESTNSLPTTAGNYYLTGDVTISSTWSVPNGTVNLCLNDHKIAYSGSSGSVIRIDNGATLKLYDCGTTVHYYYIGAASTYNSSCLGAIVASTSDANYVNATRRGSFTGGYITGGYGTSYSGSTVFGGGVFVDGGAFVLNGGCIFGNRLSVRDGGNGGGGVAVRKTSSSFVMNGGSIIGNHAGRFGGGIRIDGGSFTMNGGEIRHNTANTPGSGGAGCGGGLHMGGLDGGATVTIAGGIIEGNYAGLKDGRGGGIQVAGGTLTMTGGTVVGNNATLSGGGINGAFALSGKVTVTGNTVGGTFVADSYTLTGGTTNNVYLPTDQKITLAGAVTTGMNIGVTLESTTGTFTSGWSTYMSGKDPADYFVSDNANYSIALNASGEAMVSNAVASVTKGGVTSYYENFDSAVTAWKNGGTLKLLKNASYSGTLNIRPANGFTASDYVLDLNGKTLDLESVQVGKDSNPNKLRAGPTLTLEDSGEGGIVRITGCNMIDYGGLMILRGGTITGGNGTWGACFLLHIYGSLDMYDGVTLTGSTSNNFAGGVFVGSDSEFNMYGGLITGNSATNYGGGVVLSDNDGAVFNLYGGTISGNTAAEGNGVAVLTGSFNIKGDSAILTDGVYLASGKKINIGSTLSETPIGITLQNNTGVFTSGLSGKGTAANFKSDDDRYDILPSNGEAKVAAHEWSYAASANVITATCANCTLSQTLTLNAPENKTYDGTAITAATLSKSDKWTAAYGLPESVTITYSGDTNAGTHEASVTLGDATATAEFTIAKKTLTVTADAKEKTYGDDDPAFTYTASGLVGSDSLTGALSRAAGEDVGNYGITLGTLTAGDNYTISYTGANLTIKAAPMSVSALGYTGDYDGEAHGITVTVASPEGTTVKYGTKSGEYTLDSNPTYINAGSYTVYYQVTKDNYITASGSAVVTINKINATVTITGNSSTIDYNGTEHMVTGYVATADTDLYDVTQDFTFSGDATAKRTNAGTTNMGLAAGQFANTNANFATVTFNVTDGYQTINKINATVTIIGNTNEGYYNSLPHTVTGYVVTEVDTPLYHVESEDCYYTFSGTATATQTEAGITYMGLAEDQFANLNENFEIVTFAITDGYQKVLPSSPTILRDPQAKDLTANGYLQELIVEGDVAGGTFEYALGTNNQKALSAFVFDTRIPSANTSGTYYVWYKVVGDSNHESISPICLQVTIKADEALFALHGTLYQSNGETPQSGASITLMKGNQIVGSTTTDQNGKYQFDVSSGVYNLVAKYRNISETALITVVADEEQDLILPDGKTESLLKVKAEKDSDFGVVVGGLDKEAYHIREAENVPDDQKVSVVMTVETKTEETATNAEAISSQAADQLLDFFEIKVEKTVNSVTTLLDETANVLEIVVPFEKVNRKGITVYSYHGEDVKTFQKSDSKAAGTFRVDKENGLVYIYSKEFSTYAIGYTQSYRVNTSISLGNFKGIATVTLQNQNDGTIFTLENVAIGNMTFEEIPKGNYTMTVTWEDGKIHTITMPLAVSDK